MRFNYKLILLSSIFLTIEYFNKVEAQYYAVNIPDDKLLSINIDGNIEDWNWIPNDYIITNKDITHNNDDFIIQEQDLNIKLRIAWSSLKNWIFIIAEIEDDYHQVNTTDKDELIIRFDPSNIKGKYKHWEKNSSSITGFNIRVPLKDKSKELSINSGSNWFLKDSSQLIWKWKIINNTGLEGTLTTYEIGASLWDIWHKDGYRQSIRHQLTENETIGINILFKDVDEDGTIKNRICISDKFYKDWWENSANFPSFKLLSDLSILSIDSKIKTIFIDN